MVIKATKHAVIERIGAHAPTKAITTTQKAKKNGFLS